MAGRRVLPAPRFFFLPAGAQELGFFFYWRQAAKKQKTALVLIEFSGVSLHGE
jgi:hypothetical protein